MRGPIHHHSNEKTVSDAQLLCDVTAGCTDCFSVLFQKYVRPVYGVAHKILRDRAEAEDVVQEVFLAIYLQQHKFDSSRGTVRTWILQFAYFKALLRRRYLSVRKFYKQEEIREGTEPAEWSHPAQSFGLNYSEWTRFVETGIQSLTEKQRRTIELVHLEGYTLAEAAAVQGESLANTRNCYYRGLTGLRQFLGTNPGVEHRKREPHLLRPSAVGSYDEP